MGSRLGKLRGKSKDAVCAEYKKMSAEETFSERVPDPDSEQACKKAMQFDLSNDEWVLTYRLMV